MHPDADYGAQFSEGGLVQDTIQQASNRFKGPAVTSGQVSGQFNGPSGHVDDSFLQAASDPPNKGSASGSPS